MFKMWGLSNWGCTLRKTGRAGVSSSSGDALGVLGGRSGSGRAAPLLGDALGVLGGEAVSLFQGKSMPSSFCFGAWFSHPPGSQVGPWCVPGLTRLVTPCSGEVIYTEARAGGSAMMSVQGKSAQMPPDRELKAEHKHDGAARHA